MTAWTYLFRCANGSFYVGSTTDLDTRIGEHQGGERSGYTATRRPVELAWPEKFQDVRDAIAAERRIKGWSRAKKEALIAADWDTVRQLGSREAEATRSIRATNLLMLRAWLETPHVVILRSARRARLERRTTAVRASRRA